MSRGLVSGLELGLARAGLVGGGLYCSGLSWGFDVVSDNVGVVGSGLTFCGSAVVTPGVTSSCAASVDVGVGVVRASSSDKFPAGETLMEGSSRSAGEGPVVTSSPFFSISSGWVFAVVASGKSVWSGFDEAGVLVPGEFSRTVEEPVVGPVDAEGGKEAVVVTSGLSVEATVRSVLCASGKMSSPGCASACPTVSIGQAAVVG